MAEDLPPAPSSRKESSDGLQRRGVTTALTPEVVEAARREKEVTLTTIGRKTGIPRRVTIWITTDGEHLFVRSGGGLKRDWPQNLLARGEATLRLGGRSIRSGQGTSRTRRKRGRCQASSGRGTAGSPGRRNRISP